MTLKRIGLIGFIFAACLASYFTLRTNRATTDPAASVAGFFMFRAHCPAPKPTGYLHLLQANVPF